MICVDIVPCDIKQWYGMGFPGWLSVEMCYSCGNVCKRVKNGCMDWVTYSWGEEKENSVNEDGRR